MTWFKNLNTMTKLMLGFGFLALLMGVVGYQGVSGMSEIDSMVGTLYQEDMAGISAIKDVNALVAMIGREMRDVVIQTDAAVMERDKQKVDKLTGELDSAMTRCEKAFYSEQGKAMLAKLNEVLPQYKELVAETIRVAMTNDKKAAVVVLAKTGALGDRALELVQEAVQMKESLGQEKFERSAKLYQQSRTLVFSIVIGAVFIGLALGYFIAKLIATPLGRTVEVLESVAAGDLTRSMDVATADEIGRMAKALNAAVGGMRDALTEVRGSADSLATASQQLAGSSEELSSGAQEQASSLEETSASLEEITSSVKQNADNAGQANQLAAAARDTAEKGGHVVSSAVTAMGEINTSSKKIADIITTIDEIAFQTNLLALNAAVEAARAGEQGRGFAVVAAEVRTLAQRSATAAKEIKTLIQDSVRKVEVGSQMVNQSGEVLRDIVSSVKRVTDIVGEIAAASREQSTGVDQVAKAVSQMDQVTQQNAAQTEELSSTAQELSASAEQLQALVARFQLENERGGRRAIRQAPPAVKAGPRKTAFTPGHLSRSLHSLSKHVAPAEKPMPALDHASVPVSAGDASEPGGFA